MAGTTAASQAATAAVITSSRRGADTGGSPPRTPRGADKAGAGQQPDAWAPLADRFIRGHYGTLRGRVRTHVIGAHLRAHLPPPPAALVDVGGGAGNQSIPLARYGYQLTIADPSEAMLAGAADALANEPPEVAKRVRLVRTDAESARAALGGQRFAGVLCHGVIMYVDDPRPFTAALAELTEPGGIVSLVAKNARSLATRPALEGRWTDALAAFDTDRQVNGLGVDTRADTIEDLSALLSAAGVTPVAWYGVRLFTDGWVNAYDQADPGGAGNGIDALLAVELEASRRDPYRQLSRLFHLVGVRR
ncbi:MAG: methyltransferase [Streptosporangiaceae bacterium]